MWYCASITYFPEFLKLNHRTKLRIALFKKISWKENQRVCLFTSVFMLHCKKIDHQQILFNYVRTKPSSLWSAVFLKRVRNLCFTSFVVFNIEIIVSAVFCSMRISVENRITVFRVSNLFGITTQKVKLCCKMTLFHDCSNSTEFGSFKLMTHLRLMWSI